MSSRGRGVALAVVLCGCVPSAPTGVPGTAGDELRPLERKLVGAGQAYPADLGLRAREAQLASSQAARRAAAWEVVARVLSPVELEEQRGSTSLGRRDLPRFRTWYGRDDLERVFRRLHGALGAPARRARAALDAEVVTRALVDDAASAGSWTDEDLAARLAQLETQAALEGLGGNSRVVYSPGFARDLLRSYPSVTDCLPRLPIDPALEAAPQASQAPCFAEELGVDAVVVKASWSRADFGLGLRVHDASATTLTARCSGLKDAGGWGAGEGEVVPSPDEIYGVRLADGSSFRMPALHIVTKELRHWIWITLWWSPRPDEDFGADRPPSIGALGGPWAHYKMSVVTSYAEADPDPRGGYAGTLGDALAATHAGSGGPTWTSNPYLEQGARNAQTNCIGCHQHAGVPGLRSETVLGDDDAFPQAGRTAQRRNFPFDYVFALGGSEDLGGMIAREVRRWDALD